MNVYRKVRYDNDGCDLYQCLACKQHWSGRLCYTPINYCLHCGVKFDSPDPIKCRPNTQPAWHYKRYGHIDDAPLDAPEYWKRTPPPADDWAVTDAMADDIADGSNYPFGGLMTFASGRTAKQIWNYIDVQVRNKYTDQVARVMKGGRTALFYVPRREAVAPSKY